MKASALRNPPSPRKKIALPYRRTYTSARSIVTPFRYNERSFNYVEVRDKSIGPKARIKHMYVLTDTVQLPARLYYEDKLLGTIIE